MSTDLNRIELIGRLISEPTKIKSETTICKFKLATNDIYYNKEQKTTSAVTEKHFIKCMNQNAEYALNNYQLDHSYIFLEKIIHIHLKTMGNILNILK